MISSSLLLIVKNEIEGLKKIFPQIPLEIFTEILAVDYNSDDGSREFLRQRKIKIIEQKSSGRGNAIIEAVTKSQGNYIVLFSPDGNEDSQDIPRVLGGLEKGADMVIASRFLPGGFNEEDIKLIKPRAWANRLFTLVANILWNRRTYITDSINGFRAFTRQTFTRLHPDAPRYTLEYQMTIRAMKNKLKVIEIPTIEGQRIAGSSGAKAIPTGLDFLKTLLLEIIK